MKKIVGMIMTTMVLIGSLPFLDAAGKIEWTVYLGIPMIILMGSAGAAVVTKRIEAIIGGVIISALFPVLLELLGSA